MYISGTFDVRWNNDTLNPPSADCRRATSKSSSWVGSRASRRLVDRDASVAEGHPARRCCASPFASRQRRHRTSRFAGHANGTATAGTDYVAATGSLTFTPGQTARTFDVTIKGDLTRERTRPSSRALQRRRRNGVRWQRDRTIANDDGVRTGGPARRPNAVHLHRPRAESPREAHFAT
jgi:hypothetical protein